MSGTISNSFIKYTDIHGLKISRMTLGTVQLGMNYGIANKTGKPSMERAFDILDIAVDGGINSFDTANAYGDSEDVLGNYFSSSRCKIKKPLVTTKFILGLSGDGNRNTIEKEIYSFAEKSLQKLRINRIPIFMLHNATNMFEYGNAVPETLKKLRSEGLIEKAGVSVYNPEEVEEMLKHDIYEAVQLPMNAFDMRMARTGILEKLRKAGCIVFARSVFLQGLFFMDADQLPEKLTLAATYLKQLRKLAEQEGLSVAQLALSFIRDIEGITSLVLGSETPEQVADNIRLMGGPVLSSHLLSEIEKLSEQVPIEEIMIRMRTS